MSFPSREERTACWSARDRYWKCLDDNKIESDSPESPCAEYRKLYQNGCPATWVKHFDRRYKYLQFKDKIEKEGIPSCESRSRSDLSPIKNHRIYRDIV